MDLTHLIKTAGINFQDVLGLPSDQQGNKHYVPGKKDEKRSDSIPVRDDLDMVKEEKMTQVLCSFVCFIWFVFIFSADIKK